MNYTFVEACQSGDLPTVEKWFHNPTDPLDHDSLSKGFVHACEHGHAEIAA